MIFMPPIDTIYIATYTIVNGEPVRLYGNRAEGVGFGGLYHSYEAHYGGSPHVDFATLMMHFGFIIQILLLKKYVKLMVE